MLPGPAMWGRPHGKEFVGFFSDAWNMRQAHPLTGGGTTVTLKPARMIITSPSPTSQTGTCPQAADKYLAVLAAAYTLKMESRCSRPLRALFDYLDNSDDECCHPNSKIPRQILSRSLTLFFPWCCTPYDFSHTHGIPYLTALGVASFWTVIVVFAPLLWPEIQVVVFGMLEHHPLERDVAEMRHSSTESIRQLLK
ncbi:hypothetical protein BC827DRAFT_1154804 [Russula dissimulans]|nr:hypothetical protein BC827DRAFT_1154804 [Russula dissimulans]